MHKPIIQGSVAWQDLYDQGYVVVKKDEYMSHWPTQGWQPIETAPKDGTEILVYAPGFCQTALWESYTFSEGWVNDSSGNWLNDPTHWMPLPEPPK